MESSVEEGRQPLELELESLIKNSESHASPPTGGGPLKVTDPAAFARLMEDMKLKSEQQQEAERKREAERAKREGSSYKSKEERAKEARDAKNQSKTDGKEEARSLEDAPLDPSKDYYAILGIDRAAPASEVRKSYKRYALLYHPDKHKDAADQEQRDAIAKAFRGVSEAFDILIDEEKRALYDKVRDYRESNPGNNKGLPPLSPEEAKLMQSGLAELSKLRRQGMKLGKHPALEREVWVSLPKLNAGCTKSVAVERRRLDYQGLPVTISRTFHLVIRKGSKEGMKLVFDGEGEESVDTEAGDMVFILRAKPHPVFRRSGVKDLEIFATAIPAGDVRFCLEIETIHGVKKMVYGSALVSAFENGGKGGEYIREFAESGLYDSDAPVEKPAGKLTVKLRYPPVILSDKTVYSCIKPRPVYLLGSADESVPASLAAGPIAAGLCHAAEARHMKRDYKGAWPKTRLVCVSIKPSSMSCTTSSLHPDMQPATLALVSVLESTVPGLEMHHIVLDSHNSTILDDDWCALHTADVIILEIGGGKYTCEDLTEDVLRESCDLYQAAGVAEAVWKRSLLGSHIIGVGFGCSLLGYMPCCCSSMQPFTILAHYNVRCGGGEKGWSSIETAMELAASTNSSSNKYNYDSDIGSRLWVGVLASSVSVVNTATGYSELIVAPRKDVLVDTAGWWGSSKGVAEEADDDYGFFAAWQI